MKLHKKVTTWTRELVQSDACQKLVKQLYTKSGDSIYGQEYEYYTSRNKSIGGSIYTVREFGKTYLAIATRHSGCYKTNYADGTVSRKYYRVMLLLNEEGERLVRKMMLKALL